MDNTHEPPNGNPQDNWPTQEIGPSGGQGSEGHGWGQGPRLVGPGGPAQGGDQPAQAGQPPRPPVPPGAPAGSARPARPARPGRALCWGTGLVLVVLLAGGGVAAAELSGSSGPAPTAPTGQAAALNTVLSSASSATTSSTGSATAATAGCQTRANKLKAAGHPAAAQRVLRLCGHPLRRLRLLGGEHGEFTFNSKTGPRTIAFERGVVESVSSSDIVVQAKDGTTWTWVLQGNTVIRQDGKRGAVSSLSDGQHVFAGGPVVSGGYDARLIAIAASSGSAPSPSSTPSPSSSASGS
jgi:hypothetical protein